MCEQKKDKLLESKWVKNYAKFDKYLKTAEKK